MIFCGTNPEQIILVPKFKLVGGTLKLQGATQALTTQSKRCGQKGQMLLPTANILKKDTQSSRAKHRQGQGLKKIK